VLDAAVVISQGDLRRILTGGVGLGELCILGCVLCWAAYSLIGKAVMRRLSPLVSVSYSSAIGAFALAVPAATEGLAKDVGRASLADWGSIAYLAVFGTVLGFVWFYEGVRLIGATRAGLFINFVSISAVILATAILGGPITWSLAIGAALVLLGIYLTNRTAKGRRSSRDNRRLRRPDQTLHRSTVTTHLGTIRRSMLNVRPVCRDTLSSTIRSFAAFSVSSAIRRT
jgi:drug/metabolite transporter (DMT)-like permease